MAESIYDTAVDKIDGTHTKLGAYRGKVLLIVNVASECGLTPQYEGLEALYESKRDKGLEILGFPANDFGSQEPGSNAEIASFCSLRYGVKFPMFAKISVKGDAQHPLYHQLTSAKPEALDAVGMREKLKGYGIDSGPPGDVLWNFEKFLLDRKGSVVGRFAPDIAPSDARLLAAIDRELAK
jgi:glutathione peroxidase